jgi:hypothetical protein
LGFVEMKQSVTLLLMEGLVCCWNAVCMEITRIYGIAFMDMRLLIKINGNYECMMMREKDLCTNTAHTYKKERITRKK